MVYLAKLVFWSILSFKNWSFAYCSAFGASHFWVSFSHGRKSERIERKFKTQNPISSSSSSSSSGKSASSNSSKKLQTGNGNNVRRSSFTEFCKKNCKLPRRTSGATAAAAASGWNFVLFQLSSTQIVSPVVSWHNIH